MKTFYENVEAVTVKLSSFVDHLADLGERGKGIDKSLFAEITVLATVLEQAVAGEKQKPGQLQKLDAEQLLALRDRMHGKDDSQTENQ